MIICILLVQYVGFQLSGFCLQTSTVALSVQPVAGPTSRVIEFLRQHPK